MWPRFQPPSSTVKLFPKLKPAAAPIAVIIAFFIAFFWPAIFSGMLFVSGDALVYSYPMRQAAWEMIRNGSLPMWTPLILSGYPPLSMAQLGIGYPLIWGYLFLQGRRRVETRHTARATRRVAIISALTLLALL